MTKLPLSAKAYFFLYFIFHLQFASAQNYNHEAGLWTGTQFNLDLPKQFSFSIQYQLRLDKDFYRIRGNYFSGSLQYDIVKKYLSAELDYRYKTSRFGDQHRFGLGISGKYKYKRFGFGLRTVYQRGYEYFNPKYEPGHEPTNYIRNRVQLKVDLPKRFDLNFSGEAFLNIDNKGANFDRWRTVAGLSWEVAKSHHIDLFYLNQFSIGKSNPTMQHNLGFMYGYDIPRFWKSKKKKKNAKK